MRLSIKPTVSVFYSYTLIATFYAKIRVRKSKKCGDSGRLKSDSCFFLKKKNIWLSLIDEVLKLIANDFRETISAPETFSYYGRPAISFEIFFSKVIAGFPCKNILFAAEIVLRKSLAITLKSSAISASHKIWILSYL